MMRKHLKLSPLLSLMVRTLLSWCWSSLLCVQSVDSI